MILNDRWPLTNMPIDCQRSMHAPFAKKALKPPPKAVGKEPAGRKKLQRLQFSHIVCLWTLELPVFCRLFSLGSPTSEKNRQITVCCEFSMSRAHEGTKFQFSATSPVILDSPTTTSTLQFQKKKTKPQTKKEYTKKKRERAMACVTMHMRQIRQAAVVALALAVAACVRDSMCVARYLSPSAANCGGRSRAFCLDGPDCCYWCDAAPSSDGQDDGRCVEHPPQSDVDGELCRDGQWGTHCNGRNDFAAAAIAVTAGGVCVVLLGGAALAIGCALHRCRACSQRCGNRARYHCIQAPP